VFHAGDVVLIMKVRPLSPNAIECLGQLFVKGPTWDGDIVSKVGRGELFECGLVDRVEGFSFLTREGVQLAIEWNSAELRTWHDQRWYRKKSCLP
jgi:hypothetical protein